MLNLPSIFNDFMRSGFWRYILIILLLLLMFGVISVKGVFNAVFYIIMAIVLMVVIAVLVFRYRLNRIRKEMERDGTSHRTYSWGTGRNNGNSKKEGDVTIKQTSDPNKKVVRNEIGDYVEYEEIVEIINEESDTSC